MKINWSLRLKNKTTLMSLCVAVIALVYEILSIFSIVPQVSQSTVAEIVGIIITILTTLGIVTDPTTKGLSDSNTALNSQKLMNNCKTGDCDEDSLG